jgi:hypothetical protein
MFRRSRRAEDDLADHHVYRKNDTSVLLKQLIKLVCEFDKWDSSAGQESV